MSWRETTLRLLRVPSDPAPPPGSPPRLFRAAPNYFNLRLIRWGVAQGLALTGVLWATMFIGYISTKGIPRVFVWVMHAGEALAWIRFAFEFVAGWAIVRLDYELRWYMLSDRAIRIREGITTVREKTIALANVQNISVIQGPLQRFLGIADVEVKTAGGGGSSTEGEKKKGGEPMHVAYFRGVDNAEEIRDVVREGVRLQRSAGLGDPDEHHAASTQGDAVAAAAELLAEARALRASVVRAT